MGKQWVLHIVCVCVCSLSCPACNAHAPYCHLWPAPRYIRPHYITKGRILEKQLLNIKFAFWFSLHILPKNFSFYEKLSEIWSKTGNFIDVFLARHVSVHTPIIRSIRCWVAAYGFVHRVFGWVVVLRAAADKTYAAALKTTTHPKTRCTKPYAATQHLMLLMMGVYTRNMSS